jgi:hypothetical protein
MVSTYTPSNRFDQQGTGDNPTTWGSRLNDRALLMIDEALDGVTTLDITVTTAYVLTTASGTTDQSRKRSLVISGTATANATVTVPALNKFYVVDCTYTGAYTVTIKTASDAGVTLEAGDGAILLVSASGVSNVLRASDFLRASNNLSDLTDIVAARTNLGLGNPTINTFTNNGSTLVRTLTQNPGTVNAMTVVFDGVVQTPGDDYTLSGTTLTYVTQPANGTKELIFIGNQSLPAGEPSDGAVTIPKLSSSVYASQIQAEAGSENTLLMTPLRVKQAIDALAPPPEVSFGSVIVGTSNGAGATNGAIRRFSNVILEEGADITYADSATLGATFTINTTGVYSISYTDSFNAPAGLAITKNASVLTSSYAGLAADQQLIETATPFANFRSNCSVTVNLTAGDIIRAHLDANNTNGAAPAQTRFVITRVQ